MDRLNPEQLEAVTSNETSLRIVAGAGTGKTTVLVNRFRYLVENKGIASDKILAVAFNKKAKEEMRHRLSDITKNSYSVWIETYHSFCWKLLRSEISIIGYPLNFETIEENTKKNLLKKFCDQYYGAPELGEAAESKLKVRHIIEYISLLKKKYNTIHLELIKILDYKIKQSKNVSKENLIMKKIARDYLIRQNENKFLDFDDYIVFVNYIFKHYPNILSAYEKKFDHILMDEFQDIDSVQYEIFQNLRKNNKNIFMVGDPDQCIYEWRGAEIDIMISRVEIDFPDLKTIALNQNYRSPSFVLDAANNVINVNKNRIQGIAKKLFTVRKLDKKISIQRFTTYKEEIDNVTYKVKNLISSGVKPCEIAILHRFRNFSVEIESSLSKKNIEYILYNNISFFDRLEISVSLDYLKLLYGDYDLKLENVINKPKRKIGEKSWEKLLSIAKSHSRQLTEMLINDIEKFKYELGSAIYKKINDLFFVIKKYRIIFKNNNENIKDNIINYLTEVGIFNYIESISLNKEEKDARKENLTILINLVQNDILNNNAKMLIENDSFEDIDRDAEANYIDKNKSVIVSTVHGVKGLEFEYVFLVAFSNYVFPGLKAEKDEEEMEEERRLAYVAYTRAKQDLFLSWHIKTYTRTNYGWSNQSRFIIESGLGVKK